jgi:hypothetical protein
LGSCCDEVANPIEVGAVGGPSGLFA